MSEFYGEQTDFIFDAQVLGEEKALSRSDWAATVFGDPLALHPRLQANWSPQLDEINEASLYNDWQTRDTVFGYGLLEPRLAQLNLAIQSYRAGLVRRQRAISMMRARLESIERINQAEPNPALKYPEDVIASMKHDLTEAEEEYAYLRNNSGRLASLAIVVDKISETGERAGQALPEQLFRLIGLSWKGRAKVSTFRLQFPHLGYQIEQTPGIPLRYKLQGTVVVDGVDLMLDEEVVSYLLHCLETIAALAAETPATLFDTRKRKQHLTEGWPPAMVMLRTIVELFYFCSFELPYTFPTVFLDRNATERILIYEEKNGQWQTITDEHPGSRLKRQAAEIVSLLTVPPPFLNCANPDDLTKYCRPSIAAESKQKPSQYQPYSSVGLAHLSGDSRSNIYKFHSGYDLSTQLIDQLIKAQPELMRVFYHEQGPVNTLLALASFEPDIFKNNFDAEPDNQFSDNDRFALLGRFWRLLGKQRPLTLLGNDYAKSIYKGMEAMGEAPPERSSLLSVHLSSIIAPTMLGKGMTQIENPLGVLKLGDQIRLVELLNVSWVFTADCFGCLQQLTDNSALGEALRNAIGSPENEKKLAINTNRKWINDQQSIWTLIRSTAPVAWDFWVRLVEKIPVQSILSKYDTEGTLNYMFQLSADLVRLMLLFETCDPVMSERISTDAETAGREMLSTFALYEKFSMLSESMHYYFEPEIRHDRWLAFVISFKKHLEEIVNNLEKTPGGKSQQEMVRSAITQLDTKYPETAVQDISSLYSVAFMDTVPLGDFSETNAREIIVEKPAPVWAISPDTLPAIDDITAQSIETICRQLIGMKVFQLGKLPEIVVLSRLPGMAEEMRFLAKGSEALRRVLDDRLSMLIFSSPRTVRDVSRLFRQHCPGGGSNVIGEQFWPPLKDYLNKVEPFNNYVKQMLGQSAIFEEGVRVRFSQAVFDRSERVIDFFLFSILGSIYCHLGSPDDGADRVSAIQGFVQSRVGEALSGWEPEVLLLGGGRLRCSNGQAVLFGGERENPHFSEPERPASARLLWYGLRMRFEIALKIFRNELHGADFTVEI